MNLKQKSQIVAKMAFLVLLLLFSSNSASAQSASVSPSSAISGMRDCEKTTGNEGVEVEIIIDFSGSMSEKIGNNKKIDIARMAVKNAINGMSDEVTVGLRAYGHQSVKEAKNCTDTQLLFPFGKINREGIIKSIDSLVPRGWTPIEYALRQAKNDFSGQDKFQKVIILVSDGEETCGGDPCKAIKELKAAGFDAVINTIGFDVNDIAEKELKCIAEASRGVYRSAKDAQELNVELCETAKDMVPEPEAPVASAPIQPEPEPSASVKNESLPQKSSLGEMFSSFVSRVKSDSTLLIGLLIAVSLLVGTIALIASFVSAIRQGKK